MPRPSDGAAEHQGGTHAGRGPVMKRVLVVADHPFAVERIRRALRHVPHLRLVGAIDGRRPVAAAAATAAADVVIVDEMRRFEDALARVRELAAAAAATKIVVAVSTTSDLAVDGAFEAGADAVLSKAVEPVAFGTLLREVLAGTVVHRPRRTVPVDVRASRLTPREVEILGLAAQGLTNGRIAGELWITEQTVKFHLSNCYRKLGVANRTQATRYAFLHALLAPPDSVAS
jgi:DNA-binding NarL/FixJ family response regulator